MLKYSKFVKVINLPSLSVELFMSLPLQRRDNIAITPLQALFITEWALQFMWNTLCKPAVSFSMGVGKLPGPSLSVGNLQVAGFVGNMTG